MVVIDRPSGTLGPVDKENPMTTQSLQPHVNTSQESPIYFLGLPTILRATGQTTNGAFGLVEQSMPPGFASPYHTHHLEDEAFYVLEGEMAFVCDGQWTIAGPGTYVFGPREIPHGFKVLGEAPARMLLLCTPGGFAEFVVEMSGPTPAPPDMAKLMALAAKYKVDILGPLPEQADAPATSTNASSSTSLHDAVDRIRAQHIAAVNAGDIGAALGIFATDVAVMPPGQPALQGASLREWFTYVFSNFTLEGFGLRPDAVEQYGNAAIEHGTWSATLQPRNGSPSQPVGGTYLTVYARLADGSVRVIRDIFNGMPG
jgi:quercetin dioxygenase-like cupin family protein/ketosteroid isomerase-like protein